MPQGDQGEEKPYLKGMYGPPLTSITMIFVGS